MIMKITVSRAVYDAYVLGERDFASTSPPPEFETDVERLMYELSQALALLAWEQHCEPKVTLLGWTEGDGSGHEGYRIEDYFDAEGKYLGPDEHGIEPIFDVAPEPNALSS